MIHLNYIEIGDRIRNRRKQLGLTQKQVAELMDLSEGSISRYESGKIQHATTSTLNKFAVILQVEPAWLIGFKVENDFEHRLKSIIKDNEDIPEDILNDFLDMLENQISIYRRCVKWLKNNILNT